MPTTRQFRDLYRRLNSSQRAAVDAIDGPVMVIAGPGTGKTNILTLRIANILARTDTPPEAILALTYTTNGAAEMQQRLAAIIGADAYRVTITTFHGLCENIIRENPDHFSAIVGRRVADDSDRRRIMEELFRSGDDLNLLASFGDEPYYLPHALKAIESLKTEGISADRFLQILDAQKRSVHNVDDLYHEKGSAKGKMKAEYAKILERVERLCELVALYRKYEKLLADKKLYDYSDMITCVRDVLEKDENFRLSLQEQYQYLLVDEHQDTNSAQNRIVELLAGFFDRPNLFIVGDEKQAIYRFQGASIGNFMYFKDRFKDVKLIALSENYRSNQKILDAAHGVRASRQPLRAWKKQSGRPIATVEANSVDSQHFIVGRLLQKCIKEGTPPGQIAVLYRNNADGQELASSLARMDVPYALEASSDVLDDDDIGRLMLLLEAIADYGESGPLLRALYVSWLAVPPLDIYKLIGFCGRERNPYDVIASTKLMSLTHIAEPERLLRVSGLLARWQGMAKQERAEDVLAHVVRDSGCLAALVAHPQAQEKFAKLHVLHDISRKLVHGNRRTSLNHLTNHLRYIRDHGIRLDVSMPRKSGRVRLMTAHAAKGLEFDAVFMIDAYEGHWPKKHPASPLKLPAAVYSLVEKQDIEEMDGDERNLFYVALTRARRQVTVCWPQQNRDGGKLERTRYLSYINPSLVQSADISKLESEYSANGQIRFTAPHAERPDLSDKEYLNDLFIKQGLSVTALNNYLTCPWQYFYRSLVRIPEPLDIHLMYGNAVDRALERYFNMRVKGEQSGIRMLLKLFSDAVREQPFGEYELQRMLKRGTHSLRGWHARWQASWISRSQHQVRISGIPIRGHDRVTMNGKLDKLEFLDDVRVNVVDYKTGTPKSRSAISGTIKSSDGNYLRQLAFYRILLDQWKNGRYRMEEGIIDFIDPDSRGIWHREAFAITQADTGALLEQIEKICGEIMDLAFWDRRCDDRTCEYCQLRELVA